MFSNKEYIIQVYKEKSFSEAAKNLYISQPSLSATVKRVEEKLSAPIFDRSTNPITLTEIGREYIRTALEIKKCEEDFANYLSDSFELLKGEIALGGTNLFSSYVIPPMISAFNKSYPDTTFKIREARTKILMSLIVDGELDIVIDNTEISDENISSYVFSSEMLLLAVPKKLEVNEKLADYQLTVGDVHSNLHNNPDFPRIPLSRFKNESFIFLKQENNTGKRAHFLCKKHKISPRVIFELDQQVTSYNITASGLGISFVSDTLIKSLHDTSEVVFYKLTDDEIIRNIYFFVKKNKYLTNACRKFIDVNCRKS